MAAFFNAMEYEMEIKEEAKVELRVLPEDIRRQIGFRLHCSLAGFPRRREEAEREQERIPVARRELSRIIRVS